MSLAAPAPRVEQARAQAATYAEPATADRVQSVEPARASAAPVVEPATLYDTPISVTDPAKSASSVSVAMLRGGSGADLECHAAVLRGAPKKNILQILLPWIYGDRDFVSYGECKKYILIKGGSCFVFGQESDPSPIYAIPLDDSFVPVLENRDKPDPKSVTINPLPDTNKSPPHMVTVLLKYRKDGKQAYQFTFDTSSVDKSAPKRFIELVEQAGKQEKQPPVTASVMVADRVGREKMNYQPDI